MADGGTIGIWVDITDLKRRESSFRLLFDSNPLPMWVYDRETLRFLAVNDAAVKHYGYSREQFLAMSILDIRPPELRDEVERDVRTQIEWGPGRLWQHTKADGSFITVEIFTRALTHEGRSAGLVAVSVALIAVSPWVAVVVFAVGLNGLFSGVVQPATASMIGLETPPEAQSTVFGANASSVALGFCIGPLIGGGVAAAANVEVALLVIAALAVGLAVLVATGAREPAR